jgi:hypothetical protein
LKKTFLYALDEENSLKIRGLRCEFGVRKTVSTANADIAKLKANGEEPVLTQTRWLLLKRPERLTEKQGGRLAELLRLNPKTVRASAQRRLPVFLERSFAR